MIDFFKHRLSMDEAKFAGSSIKMFGQSDRTVKELSMKKKWKAGVQRALVGPSTKKKPLIFRTMGKDAKEMQKKADALKKARVAVRDQAKNKLNIAKHVVNKMRKEDTSFKVSIEGLPDLYMNDKTPGALLQKLRKIIKQPSLIRDVGRIDKQKVKKAYRDKAQGREVAEDNTVLGDYGTTKSVKKMKNITPGEKFIEAQGADSKGHFRSTKSGAGMTAKGVAAVNRKTGGNLKTAVTGKVKAGSKDAGRRKSFCARMSGMKGPMKDEKGRPTRKAMSLKRWKC